MPDRDFIDLQLTPMTRRAAIGAGARGIGVIGLGSLLSGCGLWGGEDDPNTQGAPSSGPRRGGSVKVAIGDATSNDTPDPTKNITYFTRVYCGLCFDALVHLDDRWNVSPMLAEEWTVSPDFRTYTFKLRQGVEFHNGKVMDSADVAYTFRRIFDEEVGSAGLSAFDPVLAPRGIETPDASTIRFRLEQPDAYFLIKVGHWYGKVVPDGTTDFTPSATASYGTGPFRATSFTGGQGFETERNPNYWQDGRPYLDAVSAVVITEGATRAQAVLSGDTDITDPPLFPTLPQFESSNEVELLEGPFGPAFVFGIDSSTPPFANADFRRASKLAVDRAQMVEIVARGFATAAPDGIVNPNEEYFPAGFEPPPHDPEQAQSLVRSSGQSQPLTIWTTDSLRALGDGATLLAEQWGAAGIRAEVRNVSFDELFGRRFLQDKIVANYWTRQHFSTILPFMYTSGGPYNEARIADDRIDELVNDLLRTPLDEGGQDILTEIVTRYQDGAATLWPFHMKEIWGHKRRVQGLELSPVESMDFRQAFVS